MKRSNIDNLRKRISSWWLAMPQKGIALPGTKAARWLLFILLALLTTALVSYRAGKIPADNKIGQIAPYDIKADRDYEIVDEEATAKFKVEALQNVKPTYTFDPFLGNGITERLKTTFDEMRKILETYSLKFTAKPGDNVNKEITAKNFSEEQIKNLKVMWEDAVGVDLTDKEWKFLIDEAFGDEVLGKLSDYINVIMSNPIIADRRVMAGEKGKGVAVRILPATGEKPKDGEEDWDADRIASVLTVDEIREEVLKGKFTPKSVKFDDAAGQNLAGIAAKLIQSNMIYDAQETELKRQSTLKDIKNVVISVQSGESIIRGGSRYEPWHIKVIEGIRREKSARSLPLEMVGSFMLIVTIYLVVYVFGRKYVRRFAPTKLDLVFMGSLMLMMLLLLRIAMFFASAMYGITTMDIPRTALTYAIPMAAGAMLVRFTINSETAALFAIVLAAFSGIVVQGNIYFTAFTLISSLVAAVTISHSDKRSSIIHAGIIAGLINAILVLSIHLVNAASVIEPLSLNNIMWYELSAFANGIGCAVFILVVAPLTESVFGYTTDIKLLELANLNHPLLRELIIRAPGTYHHSHLVGILAETAAEAVGANPLLTRVGAYYHDIGKIKKPIYFTENMPDGESIHDNLSPHMSALIVGSHIKEGIELANMYSLPKVITAMIPEHHGTKKIGFFYQKAKESTDPSLQKIEEKDFKYPGPKPQSREAAILMLADGTEAAVRSLKEKMPTRIQQIVENFIDRTFTEGQLNECELTLKDLNEIAKAFTRILSSIYHQRIEYPKETLEREKDEMSVFEEGEVSEGGGGNAPSK